jgi:hypothetical protein
MVATPARIARFLSYAIRVYELTAIAKTELKEGRYFVEETLMAHILIIVAAALIAEFLVAFLAGGLLSFASESYDGPESTASFPQQDSTRIVSSVQDHQEGRQC